MLTGWLQGVATAGGNNGNATAGSIDSGSCESETS
jgi:hypothetical protein